MFFSNNLTPYRNSRLDNVWMTDPDSPDSNHWPDTALLQFIQSEAHINPNSTTDIGTNQNNICVIHQDLYNPIKTFPS